LARAAELLDSPLASEGFLSECDVQNGHDGSRLYKELNTGKWWEKTENMREMPEGATLLPIILYADGT